MKKLYRLKLWFSFACFFLAFVSVSYAQNTVDGTVVDGDNQPIIGASVMLEGTSQGTITDLDGKFSIDIPDGGATLNISFIGYKNVALEVNGDQQMLDAIVIILAELVATGTWNSSSQRPFFNH